MYGTIFRMKVKPGQQQALIDGFDEWDRERKPHVKGALGGFLFRPDAGSDEMIGIAMFEDKASYVANGDDPEQHNWFMKMRELLAEDPAWEDGEYVMGGFS